ncbi:MAG: hypothetical protein M1840_004734 [Geoglossum simile]|nr:MAG: hypothetical protein M1840_004734 [Geoglossum simile]
MSTTASRTPIEDAIRVKIVEALKPSTLEIYNDSYLHSHHQAMKDSTSDETHFRYFEARKAPAIRTAIVSLIICRLIITSEAFRSKMQPARHRIVYSLLKEEMERPGGIHALQLRTMTPEEGERQNKREKQEQGETIADVEKA